VQNHPRTTRASALNDVEKAAVGTKAAAAAAAAAPRRSGRLSRDATAAAAAVAAVTTTSTTAAAAAAATETSADSNGVMLFFHEKSTADKAAAVATKKRGRKSKSTSNAKNKSKMVTATSALASKAPFKKRLRTSSSSDSMYEDFEQQPRSKGARRGLFQTVRVKATDGQPQEHHNLVLTNFDATKYTSGLSCYDIVHKGDTLRSPEYASDIFQRLYQSEVRFWKKATLSNTLPHHCLSRFSSFYFIRHVKLHNSPSPYMHKQKELSAAMRAVLVDWLVEIHLKFRCEPETLHLAVNVLDRYLTSVDVPRNMLQLVGVTAFLLAAKYEEIYPPEVCDIVRVTDRAYSRQDVLDMEADILSEISFNMSVSTGYPFVQRFLFITHATPTMSNAAKYYMDRMLQEHDSLDYRPSVLAAAAVCLAINHPEIRDSDEIETEKPGVVSGALHR
jgi:Cyclin, N-terminal domain/Cyclin, C-terminal domain